MNDDRRVAIVQQNLAEVEASLGNPARSLELTAEVQKFYQRDYDPRGLAGTFGNMAAYHILLAQFDEAEDSARQSLRYGREGHHPYIVGIAAQHLAQVAAARHAPKTAARFLGYADSVYQKLGIQREPTEAKLYAQLLKMLRDQLRDSEIEAVRAEGAALTDDQIADLPLNEKQ